MIKSIRRTLNLKKYSTARLIKTANSLNIRLLGGNENADRSTLISAIVRREFPVIIDTDTSAEFDHSTSYYDNHTQDYL